jgi:hypothetical protein
VLQYGVASGRWPQDEPRHSEPLFVRRVAAAPDAELDGGVERFLFDSREEVLYLRRPQPGSLGWGVERDGRTAHPGLLVSPN